MSAPIRHPAILVVDDEPDILIILRRLMRDMTSGYDILTASDGVDALSKIEERPVSLVITDYTMPRMDGLQLSTEIKSRSPGTYILMISACGLHDMRKRAQTQHVDYYLAKPFTLETLEQILHITLA
jgi:YesN/AraC family two-component response regulator